MLELLELFGYFLKLSFTLEVFPGGIALEFPVRLTFLAETGDVRLVLADRRTPHNVVPAKAADDLECLHQVLSKI